MTIFTVPWMLVFAGRAEEGLQECRAALKIFDPFSVGHLICGYAWDALHIPEKAIKEYKRSLEIAEFPDAYGSLAYDYGLQGDREQAESCLKRLGEMKSLGYQSAYFEALFYAGLGEAAKAVQALEKAYAQKCDWLIYLNVEHRWDALREKAGFQAIVKRVGL
jgi:tetratricopeptide (TPR) repeat protein